MSDLAPDPPLSDRARALAASKQRRLYVRERRRRILDCVVAGYSHVQIADSLGISVRSVRRQVHLAIRERPPEPAEAFVGAQRARLDKALGFIDAAMEGGDLRAVAALVSVMPHLDRYWGLQSALRAAQGAESGHVLAPNPMKSLETGPNSSAVAEAPAGVPADPL